MAFNNDIHDEDTQALTEDQYKSIVIGRDNDNFKILSGDFKDKKDVITTYDDDYVIKRVYEKNVFDWIAKNAKNAVDAYLLYSIAYRKWQNNNLLNDYYKKLIKDIPNLKDDSIYLRDPRYESVESFEEALKNEPDFNQVLEQTLKNIKK